MDTNNQIEVLDNIPETPKKNKRIKYIIMIIVIVLCLGIGGLFYYKETVLFNKKKVIGTSINEVFNVLESNLDNINNSIIPFDANEDAIGIDGSIEASSNNIEKLKDYKISYNGAFNLKENKLSGYISIINNNRNLLSLKTYINGNHGLVESGQLSYYAYNYSIAKEIRDIKINNNNNYDNIKKVIKRTKDVIVGRVNENKITKDSVEISINGKNEKYTRFTYEVNINELANDILKFYITDTSMLNTLSEITSQDSNRVKEFIQYLIDNNKGNETIKYEVYVDSLFGKFKQLVVYNTNNPNNAFKVYELDGAYKYEINFDENKISGKYSNSYINVEVSNNYLSINKLNDDQYKIELLKKKKINKVLILIQVINILMIIKLMILILMLHLMYIKMQQLNQYLHL